MLIYEVTVTQSKSDVHRIMQELAIFDNFDISTNTGGRAAVPQLRIQMAPLDPGCWVDLVRDLSIPGCFPPPILTIPTASPPIRDR